MSSCSKSVSSSSTEDDNELRRGPWTEEEDNLLIQYIAKYGEGRWNLLAKCSGLKRTGKSCRLRWLNYLKPDVKRGNLSPEEQLLILELHSKWGNRWSKIAHYLPGRTDNEIKNYWRTRIQKQARHLKMDTDSTEFREIVRRFWIPRLLQKVRGISSSAASLQNQTIPLPIGSVSQYSVMETATLPIPCWQQEACMNETVVSFAHHEQNSDSDYNNNSCISSLESRNIPEAPQFPSSNNSQFLDSGNSELDNFVYDGCFVNNNTYEMETLNPANSTANSTAAGNMEYPLVDSQMAESNWVNNDFACGGWNTDELWQFRNIQK